MLDASVTEITRRDDLGMLTVRADLASEEVSDIFNDAGLSLPEVRRIASNDAGDVAWMSPDELLVLAPHDKMAALGGRLREALSGQHTMVVDVSDARAVFKIAGPDAREALAKLCPVDLAPDVFLPGEMRRTRLAQVAAAFWVDEAAVFNVICFRSVADYVAQALQTAALPQSAMNVWPVS